MYLFFHVAARMRSEMVVAWVIERGGDLEERKTRGGRGDASFGTRVLVGCLRIVRRLVEK